MPMLLGRLVAGPAELHVTGLETGTPLMPGSAVHQMKAAEEEMPPLMRPLTLTLARPQMQAAAAKEVPSLLCHPMLPLCQHQATAVQQTRVLILLLRDPMFVAVHWMAAAEDLMLLVLCLHCHSIFALADQMAAAETVTLQLRCLLWHLMNAPGLLRLQKERRQPGGLVKKMRVLGTQAPQLWQIALACWCLLRSPLWSTLCGNPVALRKHCLRAWLSDGPCT